MEEFTNLKEIKDELLEDYAPEIYYDNGLSIQYVLDDDTIIFTFMLDKGEVFVVVEDSSGYGENFYEWRAEEQILPKTQENKNILLELINGLDLNHNALYDLLIKFVEQNFNGE